MGGYLHRFLLSILLISFSGLWAGYVESDRFAYSFYVPGDYTQKVYENDYGPLIQLSSEDGSAYIHFWARTRPGKKPTKFLLRAYEQDFLRFFIQKKLAPFGRSFASRKANTVSFLGRVLILEREYNVKIFMTHSGKFSYLIAFFVLPEKEEAFQEDFSLMMDSLQYGRKVR